MSRIPGILLMTLTICLTNAQTRPKETLSAWLCRVLNIDPDVYTKLVGVRQGREQIGGNRLAIADLRSQTESLVYDCGACWSPIAIDPDTIAFLKTDGVWVMPLRGGSPHLAVAQEGLRMLIGQPAGRPSALLLLRRTEQEVCAYALEMADLATCKVGPAREESRCLAERDLGAVPRSGALRGTRVLETSPPGAGARRLLVVDLSSDKGLRVNERRPLLEWIDERDDGIDRFDPVWVDDHRVLYVQKS
jgi:hypothetical protein